MGPLFSDWLYEEMVIKGGMNFLLNHQNWIIKTEFAPKWLQSQGTDSLELLKRLVKNFDVAELPATIPFETDSLDWLFANT